MPLYLSTTAICIFITCWNQVMGANYLILSLVFICQHMMSDGTQQYYVVQYCVCRSTSQVIHCSWQWRLVWDISQFNIIEQSWVVCCRTNCSCRLPRSSEIYLQNYTIRKLLRWWMQDHYFGPKCSFGLMGHRKILLECVLLVLNNDTVAIASRTGFCIFLHLYRGLFELPCMDTCFFCQ